MIKGLRIICLALLGCAGSLTLPSQSDAGWPFHHRAYRGFYGYRSPVAYRPFVGYRAWHRPAFRFSYYRAPVRFYRPTYFTSYHYTTPSFYCPPTTQFYYSAPVYYSTPTYYAPTYVPFCSTSPSAQSGSGFVPSTYGTPQSAPSATGRGNSLQVDNAAARNLFANMSSTQSRTSQSRTSGYRSPSNYGRAYSQQPVVASTTDSRVDLSSSRPATSPPAAGRFVSSSIPSRSSGLMTSSQLDRSATLEPTDLAWKEAAIGYMDLMLDENAVDAALDACRRMADFKGRLPAGVTLRHALLSAASEQSTSETVAVLARATAADLEISTAELESTASELLAGTDIDLQAVMNRYAEKAILNQASSNNAANMLVLAFLAKMDGNEQRARLFAGSVSESGNAVELRIADKIMR